MINKEMIDKESFSVLRASTAKKRESVESQEEALADTRALKDFAIENDMKDEVVELFLEEALIHQHFFMETKDQKYLQEMKTVVSQVGEYIKGNGLSRWESRVARFLGRVADYEKNYSVAAEYYKEAINKVSLDPKYQENKAMDLEYKGFLVMDELRLGNVNEIIPKIEKLYSDYETTEEGRWLKGSDFTAWVIWRTGVLINLIRKVIDLGKLEEYRAKVDEWLKLADSDLKVPEGVSVWSDFGFRKNEISKIREEL